MMKRVITTSVVAGLLGTLGFAPAVSAEGLYGSVRSGVYMSNPDGDGDTTWDVGVVDAGDLTNSSLTCHASDGSVTATNPTDLCPTGQRLVGIASPGDKLWSRIGVKASHELDGGLTAAVHVEKRLDNFRTRVQKVSLSGEFGTLALGQQWTTYYNATTIDGMSYLGGFAEGGPSRSTGVKYSSNLGGPFNFSAMVSDNNSAGGGNGDGNDIVELSGTLSIAGTSLSVAWRDVDDGPENMDIRVAGAFGPMNYSIGGGTQEKANGDDRERFGFHVGYQVMEGGKVYAQYEDITDDEGATDASNDWTYLGYVQTLAPGVLVSGEFRTPNTGADVAALVLRVDF